MVEFQKWPSIARLNRDMVITEKIDGTNAAVLIEQIPGMAAAGDQVINIEDNTIHVYKESTDQWFSLAAQSRKRLITPNSDNFGFAAWAYENATALVTYLGEGRHFGEYWGSGIQRGYGLAKGEKRFSLFNVARYDYISHLPGTFQEIPNLCTVPVLRMNTFSSAVIKDVMESLEDNGSYASPGFKPPEGIVVYHTAASTLFKVTFEHDDLGKWSASESA